MAAPDDGNQKEVIDVEMNFNSSPSGREILMIKAEESIAEYNKCLEDDEKQLEIVKNTIRSATETLIRQLEEEIFKKHTRMNQQMEKLIGEINDQMAKVEAQEEELKNFAAGLSMFIGDIKQEKRCDESK